MKLNIVGISGKAGSGKDTLAHTVFKHHGFMPWAFAWPLKMRALSHGFTYDEVFTAKPIAARQWLQEVGVQKRAQNPDYWVSQLDGWVRTLYQAVGTTKFVITDVRFPNEAEYIRSLGGKLVRMEHGLGLEYALAGTAAAVHESETALDDYPDWDLVIHNNIHGNPGLALDMLCGEAGLVPYRGGH